VYTVFGSDKTYHPGWALHIDSSPNDMDGYPISWRYASNEKGSLNEEGALDYLKTVLHPALGSLPPRSDALGKQVVVICDGVGTPIGFSLLEAAVELGIEIVLRVPHLNFRFWGGDTVNFGVLKVVYDLR
jgi:hypothetical protein